MPRDKKEPESLQDFIRAARLQTRQTFHDVKQALNAVHRRANSSAANLRKRATPLLRHPALVSRFSDDYIRGGAEFLTTALALAALAYAARKGLARYNTAADIPARLFRREGKLHGAVVSVHDGDGMRVRHVPFVRRMLGGGNVKPRSRNVSASTISVRLAAVDAPECQSFANKGQKYGPVARDWLRKFVVGQQVTIKLHSMDQYRRVVATVYRKHPNLLLRTLHVGTKNVALELTRAGYATLYKGAGAQYGGDKMKKVYMAAEARAKRRRVGMWGDKGRYVSPMEYKKGIRGALGKGEGGEGTGKSCHGQHVKAGEDELSGSLLWTLYRLAVSSYRHLQRYRQ